MSDTDVTPEAWIDSQRVTDPSILTALDGIQKRLRWPSMHWGVEDVHSDAWPHIAKAAAEAVIGQAHAPILALADEVATGLLDEHEFESMLRAALDPAVVADHERAVRAEAWDECVGRIPAGPWRDAAIPNPYRADALGQEDDR